jgi:hypothetical protein
MVFLQCYLINLFSMILSNSISFIFFISMALIINPAVEKDDYTLVFDGKELKLSSKEENIKIGEHKLQSFVSVRIKVKNESSEVFQISNVRGSCGLSIPSWPRNTMEPGEEQNIQIRFDTSSPGNYTKILTIHSNTHNSRTLIPVVAEVIP